MEGATSVTLATLLTNIGDMFEAAMGWAGSVGEAIASNPLLLMFVMIPLIGLGVGLFKRLINLR